MTIQELKADPRNQTGWYDWTTGTWHQRGDEFETLGPENAFRGAGGHIPMKGSAPAVPAATPAVEQGLGQLPYLGELAGGINAINLGYQETGIPGLRSNTSDLTAEISRLLNPNDPQSNYDVNLRGAETAVARGVPGSALAGETTGRIRQADVERRAALADRLMSGQVGRLPAPFDVSRMLLTPAQFQQLDLEQQRLYLDWYRATTGHDYPGGRGGGGGGDYRTAPVAPTQPSWRTAPSTTPPFITPPDPRGGWGYAPPPRWSGGEPSPDASMDEWARYYESLPYPEDPTAGIPMYEGFDFPTDSYRGSPQDWKDTDTIINELSPWRGYDYSDFDMSDLYA